MKKFLDQNSIFGIFSRCQTGPKNQSFFVCLVSFSKNNKMRILFKTPSIERGKRVHIFVYFPNHTNTIMFFDLGNSANNDTRNDRLKMFISYDKITPIQKCCNLCSGPVIKTLQPFVSIDSMGIGRITFRLFYTRSHSMNQIQTKLTKIYFCTQIISSQSFPQETGSTEIPFKKHHINAAKILMSFRNPQQQIN
jgi:hypothetical protein